MSGSGMKRIVINTRERATSDDINRAQAFIASDVAESYRMLMSGRDFDQWGAGAPNYPSTANMRYGATILGGLLVRPQFGANYMTVDPGVACFADPDAVPGADDSVYKFIRDPGVTSAIALTILPNTSGSTRIDIVECRRTELPVLESGNVDTYDLFTGLFVPTARDKVVASRLTYQVRSGIGSAFPVIDPLWLPLIVMVIPTGESTFTANTQCWDVRPLIADRVYPLTTLVDLWNKKRCVASMSAGGNIISGMAESAFGGRRAGGTIEGLYGMDLAAAAMREASYSPIVNRPWYVYACFPGDLPRWVKYTQYAPLVPFGPRGISVLTTKAPVAARDEPATTLTMPTASGLPLATTDAAMLFAGMHTASGLPSAWINDGVVTRQPLGYAPASIAPTTSGTDYYQWDLGAGVNFPQNARAVWVEFFIDGSLGGMASAKVENLVEVYDMALANVCSAEYHGACCIPPGGARARFCARLPVDLQLPAVGAAVLRVKWSHYWNTNGITVSTVYARVYGWEMGT